MNWARMGQSWKKFHTFKYWTHCNLTSGKWTEAAQRLVCSQRQAHYYSMALSSQAGGQSGHQHLFGEQGAMCGSWSFCGNTCCNGKYLSLLVWRAVAWLNLCSWTELLWVLIQLGDWWSYLACWSSGFPSNEVPQVGWPQPPEMLLNKALIIPALLL